MQAWEGNRFPDQSVSKSAAIGANMPRFSLLVLEHSPVLTFTLHIYAKYAVWILLRCKLQVLFVSQQHYLSMLVQVKELQFSYIPVRFMCLHFKSLFF